MEVSIKFDLSDAAQAEKYARVLSILVGSEVGAAPSGGSEKPATKAKKAPAKKAPAKKAPAKKAPAKKATSEPSEAPGLDVDSLTAAELKKELPKHINPLIDTKNPAAAKNQKALRKWLTDQGVSKIPELNEAGMRELLNWVISNF